VGVGAATGVCTGVTGSGAGVFLSEGAVAHPATISEKNTKGANARRTVNPTVNSHPRGVNVYRFRCMTVLGKVAVFKL
jgi:hypothetical protein